jgi:ribosomal protein L11
MSRFEASGSSTRDLISRLRAQQAGLNIMAFCKEFNARTQGIKARHIVALCAVHCPSSRCRRSLVSRQDDVPLPVLVTAYKDKSFEFVRPPHQPPGPCTRLTIRNRLQVVKNPPATYFIKKAAGALINAALLAHACRR